MKSVGFTVDAETTDEEQFGTWVYTYIAYNSDGIKVELSSVAGISSILTSA